MDRSLLSSIDEFTDMISREESNLETIDSEVQLILRELVAMKKFLKGLGGGVDKEVRRQHLLGITHAAEAAVGDGGAEKEEVARLQELQGIVQDAEAAIVNYVLETASHGGRKPLFERYACGKDSRAHENFLVLIEKLKDRFEKSRGLYRRGKSFHLRARLSGRIRSSSVDDFDEAEQEDLSTVTVVGLTEDIESLKAELLGESNHSVISILGIKGIGKTTLAWEIYKSLFVDVHFQCKAWVSVSAMDNDLGMILKGIPEQIKDGFWQDKKYLIVIDGIGDPQLWREVRAKIPEGRPGSRIILTTRDVDVAFSSRYSHRLKVLNEADSWELFKRKVFIAPWRLDTASGSAGDKNTTTTTTAEETPIPPSTLPPELDALGKKMVERCGGIPILIKELANILSTVDANTLEWSCVLHGTDTHLSQEQQPWFNLSRSVEDILPLHVKQLLHLFPTGTEIPERRLRLSWAVEDLSEQRSNSVIGRDEEKAALWRMQDLQDLNLIQAAKVNSFGITNTYCIPPDLPLLRILKAGDGGRGRGSRSSPDDYTKVWIHRIADYCDRKKGPHSRRIHGNINSTPEELEPYKTLRSFWCFNYPVGFKPGQQVGSFLKKCINNNYLWFLRVLDLEGVYKPSLPEEIGELINLRYLGLRWTFLEQLPSSVENLSKLQTLDTKHTDIGDYPTIQNMKRLQHLYLNERHPREVITELNYLKDLQTLSGVTVDDDLSHVKDGLDKLTNLRKLRLTCLLNQKEQREAMAKWIGELENLTTLKLTCKDQVNQRGDLSTLTLLWQKLNKQLSRIYLQGQLENLGSWHHLGSNNLTALTLSLTKLSEDPMPILEKLPELKLLRLFSESFTGKCMKCSSVGFQQLRVLKIWKLESLEQWTVESGAMPRLEDLEIRSCTMLTMLPDHVPEALCKLKLTDMPKEFTSTSSHVLGTNDFQKIAHVSSVVIEDWLDSNSSSVELYSGRSCVFQGWSEKLFELEGLAENLTELTLSETKLKQDPMPVLKELPNLIVLILSTKSFIGSHMVCSREGFRKLRQLTIRELEQLEEFIVEDGAMTKLEELEIISCENLKDLRQMLGTLKKLKFVKMPEKFTEKFKGDKRVVLQYW